ncbi:Fic family protein, partial [Streptomyces galilaeus]|uniref:Fic family protein n=1 Tax=Streptomyces galilaeus TaxID=33899 RepID=UPI0038F7FF59
YYDGRGKPRIVDVKVGFTLCPSPTLVPILMEMFVELWNHELKKEDDAPYAQAYYLHNVFESIHPFIDGNGRTGRLLLNMFLMAKGVEPIVI